MNIFYLHPDPIIAAKSLKLQHTVKMILESFQMLSTAHRVLDGVPMELVKNGRRKLEFIHPEYNDELYLTAHINHPSSVWVRESVDHYMWLYNHAMALGEEFTKQYKKVHLSIQKLGKILKNPPKNISNKSFTQPPCAMPDQYKTGDAVESYHNYYRAEKLKTQADIDRYNKFYATNQSIIV